MPPLLRRHRHAAVLASFILIILASAAYSKAAEYPDRGASPGRDGPERAQKRSLIGSSPPTCRWRCGKCRPCKAVRVTIHPGVSLPLDYYPEAWRCSCRGHLFMP